MTRMSQTEIKCGVCGKTTTAMSMSSCSSFGYGDLDFRPGNPAGSNVAMWMTSCEHCGYIAERLSDPPADYVETAMKHPDFGDPMQWNKEGALSGGFMLNDPNSFVRRAFIEATGKKFGKAAWWMVCAAWVIEDDLEMSLGDPLVMRPRAAQCRMKAVEYIVQAKDAGQLVLGDAEHDSLLRLDLLRRAGDLPNARRLLCTMERRLEDENNRKVMDFQKGLISAGDTTLHSMCEVFLAGYPRTFELRELLWYSSEAADQEKTRLHIETGERPEGDEWTDWRYPSREDELATIPKLVRQLYGIVKKLEALFPDRRFTPDGHLVGSLGEVLAAQRYGLELLPASSERHDAKAPDGTLIQIKLTQGRSVGLRSEPERLLVMKLLKSGEVEDVYYGPGAPAWNAAGKMQKNGQRAISIFRLKEIGATESRNAGA